MLYGYGNTLLFLKVTRASAELGICDRVKWGKGGGGWSQSEHLCGSQEVFSFNTSSIYLCLSM